MGDSSFSCRRRERPRAVTLRATVFWLACLLAAAHASACGEAQDVYLGGEAAVQPDPVGSGGMSNSGGGGGQPPMGTAGEGSGGQNFGIACSGEAVDAARLAVLAEATGFGRNVTGGDQDCAIRVTSSADSGPGTLREALESDAPHWIQFSVGEVRLTSDIEVKSNKTIDGSGGDVTIFDFGLRIGQGTSNVLIHNVAFVGSTPGTGGTGSEESDDAILLEDGARDIWIDHCDFSSHADGLIDIISAATNITVSYCHFFNHRRVMLIGNENGGATDTQIRVTLHHNWYEMTESYHPRLRRGWVHSFNNYLDQWDSFGSGSSEGGQLLSEANVYEAGPDLAATITQIADDAQPGRLRSVGDLALNEAEVLQFEPDLVFTASDYYDYEAEVADLELAAKIMSEAGTR